MYRWFRNFHLIVGLLVFPMVMMYSISALGMANGWFLHKPQVSERTVMLGNSPDMSNARVVALKLMDDYGLRGQLNRIHQTPDGFLLQIGRAGTFYKVEYSRETGKAKIRTTVASFMGLMNRLHHISGLGHHFIPIELLAIYVLIASVSLILLGATGIYLWFQFHKERKIGALLLAANLAYSITLLILIRAAGV